MTFGFVAVIQGLEAGEGPVADAAAFADRGLSGGVAVAAEAGLGVPDGGCGEVLPVEFPIPVSGG